MDECIELQAFKEATSDHDSYVSEYEGVENNENLESSKIHSKLLQEFNFFTNHNIKNGKKDSGKKKVKKKTKKHKKDNFMDVIKHELALVDTPIEENVISNVDFFKGARAHIIHGPYKARSYQLWDAEIGNNKQAPNLNPQYPQIFESVQTTASPAQYIPATKFNDLINTYDEVREEGVKFLTIEIEKLVFKNHYTISLEELLVEKLLDVHKDYVNVQNKITTIDKEIKLNRHTKESFKEDLLKICTHKEDVKFDPNLRKYVHNLFNLKDKYLELLANEKNLLHKMSSVWYDVEMVRSKSKYRKSNVQFEINKIIIDDEVYEDEWNKIFNLEISDFLDNIEYDYVTEYIKYKQEKYKEETKSKLNKPKLEIDEDEVREQVYNLVQKIVKKEKYDIKVIELKNKTKLKKRDKDERLITLKMFVDGVFVCQSELYKLQNEINISDSISIQIMPNNEMLTIKIYENDVKQSSFNINILDINKSIINAKVNNIVFIFDYDISCDGRKIGSNNTIKEIANLNEVRLRSSNVFNETIKTICEAKIKIGWNDTNDNNKKDLKTYIEVNKKVNQLLAHKGNNTLLREVIEIVYNQNIDENESLINALKNLNINNLNIRNNVDFIIDDTLDVQRLKLLHLRDKGEFADIENRLIAIKSNQIPTEQLNLLQNLENNKLGQYLHEKTSELDPLEIQRHIGRKYIENLNKNIMRNLNHNLMKNSYKDVVYDFNEFSLRNICRREVKLDNIFPNGYKQQLINGHKKEVELYITIIRAVNLPDRTTPVITQDVVDDDDEDNDRIGGFKVRPLRPFVRVSCQDEFCETVTAIGCHPTWNQTLRLITKIGCPSTLEVNLYDEVKINVNGIRENDDSLQSKTVHYRCYNRWLGNVTVPLNTIFSIGKIQGTVKINIPPLLLGYESSTKSPEYNLPTINRLMKKGIALLSLQITSSLTSLGLSHKLPIAGDDFILKHLNNFITNYCLDFPTRKLNLTLIDSGGNNKCVTQFIQPILPPNWECFPKNVKARVESAVSKSSSNSERNDDATPRSKESLYSSYEGRRSDEMTKLIFGYLRYVSLIPIYEAHECNVTLNGLELLNVLQGSHVDHAMLLASFFLYLGIKTWVVVGVGLPRGLSYYVLVKYHIRHQKILLTNEFIYEKARNNMFSRNNDEFSWYIFDASVGERYELRDATCPLKLVHYVFDEENIWVNIQQAQDCESVTFDFMKSSNWQQVFDKTIFTMKLPPITDPNIYTAPPDVEQLKQRLEAKIKAKVQKWRPHMKTIWNRYCSTLLREMLPQWEYWRFNPTESKPGLGQRTKQLMVTYKVYGFPINFTFTNMKSALAIVKNTSIHMYDDPLAEFGLAVDVFAYSNSVISVWVALATITRI